MLLDKVKITCKAGDGGNGKVSFRREKFVPNGGPDGGDGGHGGNIVFRVTNKVSNLGEFRFKKHFKAENGADGGSNNCYGKYGQDIIIYVPLGTVIRNAQNNKILADMVDINDEWINQIALSLNYARTTVYTKIHTILKPCLAGYMNMPSYSRKIKHIMMVFYDRYMSKW